MRFILLTIIMLACAAPLWADNIFGPPGSQQIKDDTAHVSGMEVVTKSYLIANDTPELIEYYTRTMAKRGFTQTANAPVQDDSMHLMRFKRGGDTVVVTLRKEDSGSKIVISEFFVPEGEGEPNIKDVTWDDFIKMMPTEDMPGSDLSNVPRPPDSIRQSSMIRGRVVVLTYYAHLPVGDIVSFYQGRMPSYGWEVTDTVDYDGASQMAQQQGQSGLADMAKVAVGTGLKMGEILNGSRQISFTNAQGSVDITLVNIDPNSPQNTMVVIYYNERDEVYDGQK